jgi:succinyl-CoA synthetase beta subunit
MKIHEYQAKQIFAHYGIPIPQGGVTFSEEEAFEMAKKIGKTPVVVKAQIHAGGRGKGGGVKVVKDIDEAKKVAGQMLGMKLVTHQTGPEGKEVNRVLIEEGLDIKKELYIGIVIDRSLAKAVCIASEAGGMEIEEVAARSPEKIIKEHIEPTLGMFPFQARRLAFKLGLTPDQVKQASKIIMALYKILIDKDCSLIEINPLIIDAQDNIIALDAKINFDDNALFKHKDVVELRDLHEEEPLEIEASKYDLNYIKLNGDVGCMVNGAGLAMATMDLIKLAGSEPANFLDVGGAASVERVSNAFRILMSDKDVKAVLINIFGGIVRCDRVAKGVIEALKAVEVDVPIVVRLEGTNAKEAAEMLKKSELNFTVAQGFEEAAKKAVELARG